MDLFTIHYIKINPLVYQYLRENSSWYKYLNRDAKALKLVEEEAKKKYQLTAEDRIAKFSRSMDLISTFIDVLK